MINDLWYKNAVIYCVSVSTYLDTNGDGIGDFQGLTRRLDYLQGLGHRDGMTATMLRITTVSIPAMERWATSSNSPTDASSGACGF
jgi:hypothetical protein